MNTKINPKQQKGGMSPKKILQKNLATLADMLITYEYQSKDLLNTNFQAKKNIKKDIRYSSINRPHCYGSYNIITASDSIEYGVSKEILRATKLRAASPLKPQANILDVALQSNSERQSKKNLASPKKRTKTGFTKPKSSIETAPFKYKLHSIVRNNFGLKSPGSRKLQAPITVQAIPNIIPFTLPRESARRKKSGSALPIANNTKKSAKTPSHVITNKPPNSSFLMKKKSSSNMDHPENKRRKVSIVDTPEVSEDSIITKPLDPPPNSRQSDILSEVSKYPVLSDEVLIKKFLSVTMTNNQKGRIRQVLKEIFSGVNVMHLPDVIHNKILSILNSSENLTDTDLRKLRVLYNMLKISVDARNSESGKNISAVKDDKQKAIDKKNKKNNDRKNSPKKHKSPTRENHKQDNSPIRDSLKHEKSPAREKSKGEKSPVRESPTRPKSPNKEVDKVKQEKKENQKKIKGDKRYVVFVGNLPPKINKEEILNHFSDLRPLIKDVRIPFQGNDKKSFIAYIELVNLPAFELALSKHHTMFNNRRINVLYTTQKNTKITKSEAKAKTAKLVAMVKSGQLAGSVTKKRSQRRAKQRQFLKLQQQQDN